MWHRSGVGEEAGGRALDVLEYIFSGDAFLNKRAHLQDACIVSQGCKLTEAFHPLSNAEFSCSIFEPFKLARDVLYLSHKWCFLIIVYDAHVFCYFRLHLIFFCGLTSKKVPLGAKNVLLIHSVQHFLLFCVFKLFQTAHLSVCAGRCTKQDIQKMSACQGHFLNIPWHFMA